MIIVAPSPFADEFADTSELERALAGHTLYVVADPDAAPERLAEAEVLVANLERQTREPLEYARAMPRLRWIHSITAGLGSVASPEIVERGVLVTNGAGVFARAIAEYALASLVMLARGLPQLVIEGASRRWAGEHPLGFELAGRRAASSATAPSVAASRSSSRARGCASTWSREAPARAPRRRRRRCSGSTACRAARERDAVVLCASLNASTRGLLGEREFAACKPGALFVNVSRGQLVDEDALAGALASGRLGGAVIDVTGTEPLPPDSPLWAVPNLWITPHLAGGTYEARARALDRFVVNLRRFAAGELGEIEGVVDVRASCSAVDGPGAGAPVACRRDDARYLEPSRCAARSASMITGSSCCRARVAA